MPTFPALPPLGERLFDDPRWAYRAGGGFGVGVAHLRVWAAGDHTDATVAVVRDLAQGVSITNAIEHIAAAVRHRYRAGRLILLEHWPADHPHGGGEHLDQALVAEGGVTWRELWPTPPADAPDHTHVLAWIAAHGTTVLDRQR
ncbi:hypothetical protein ACWDSJ_28220 [Nocardia sp. NPDC003482]